MLAVTISLTALSALRTVSQSSLPHHSHSFRARGIVLIPTLPTLKLLLPLAVLALFASLSLPPTSPSNSLSHPCSFPLPSLFPFPSRISENPPDRIHNSPPTAAPFSLPLSGPPFGPVPVPSSRTGSSTQQKLVKSVIHFLY